MPENKHGLFLSAVISEAGSEFVVSVTMHSPGEAPTIVGEESVATIDAAEFYMNQLADSMGFPSERMKKLYNVAGGNISKRSTPSGRLN